MSDHTTDINELLALFERLSESTKGSLFARRHHALTALLAERDALAAELAQRTAERDRNAERDEARRELCLVLGGFDTTRALRIAEHRVWDCFDAKEGKP
jgi:hypothetical protein